MFRRVLVLFVSLLYLLSFQACGNENSKITTELQNYSNPLQSSKLFLFSASGQFLKQSGSLQFLIGRKIIKKNFAYFFSLDRLLYENEYKVALSEWKSSTVLKEEATSQINKIVHIENELLHCKINSHLNNYNVSQEILDKLDIRWNKKDYVLQYYFLEKLQQQARIWSSTGSYQASLSALSYGLHLIETSNNPALFLRQKANLQFQKANVILNERGYEFQNSAHESFEIAKEIFSSLDDTLSVNYILINKANILSEQGKIEEGISLLSNLDSLSVNKNYLQYLFLNKGYLAYENADVRTAIYNYEKAIDNITKKDCNTRLEILYEYLFDCYLELKDFKTAEKYLSLLQESACDQGDHLLKVSYNTQSEFRLYQAKYSLSEAKEDRLLAYNAGMKYRSLARRLFGNEDELHLGDMYAENSSNLLNLFDRNKSILPNSPDWELIVDVLFDSKKLIKKSKVNPSSPEEINDIPSNIIQAISSTNDFKYNNDFTSKKYKNIYDYFLGSTQTKKIVENRIEKTKLTEKAIEVFELDNPYLVFIAYGEFCWKIYIEQDGEITLDKLSLSILSPLINQYLQSVLDKKEDREVKKQLASYILPKISENTKRLTILPDDIFQNLPFGAFLSVPHTIDFGFRPYSKPVLEAKNTSIFSYSDEESIKSINEKEFIELESGLKEAYDINSILGLTQKILKDENFNKENFQRQATQDIIHVSSHAVVKSNVRQNCFLLLNKSDGSLDTLYASEINSFDDVPMFLYLSTCNSGIGYTLQGNGKYSLSQSFMERGTESVLSTLWPVDDHLTRSFSGKFYNNWLKNTSAVEALKLTQNEFSADTLFQEPYYWAGFILEGNGNAVLSK